MIRKSTIKPKKVPASPEINVDPGLNRKQEVSNIERMLFEYSPLPVAALAGPNHTLRYVNPAFCRLAGRTKEEIIGKPFADVAFWEECLASLNRVYDTGEVVVHAEPEDTESHRAGRSYTMWPIRGAKDRPVGIMMQVEKTTLVHEAERATET
jgi:PAS domain S-box-containing protein